MCARSPPPCPAPAAGTARLGPTGLPREQRRANKGEGARAGDRLTCIEADEAANLRSQALLLHPPQRPEAQLEGVVVLDLQRLLVRLQAPRGLPCSCTQGGRRGRLLRGRRVPAQAVTPPAGRGRRRPGPRPPLGAVGGSGEAAGESGREP